MLRTLATTFQEGRLVASAARILSRRPLHSSRPYYDNLPSITPDKPLSEGEKKPRKRKTPADRPAKKEPAEKATKKKASKPVVKSVLQENRLIKDLNETERPGQTITVDDVEKYRNIELTPDPSSPDYPQQFKRRLQALEKAFNGDQLHDILKLYGIQQSLSKRTKRHCASLILETWGWVRPDGQVEKIEKVFPLKPSETFLIMMHHNNQVSQWINSREVRVKLQREPLLFNARGPRPLVEDIDAHLSAIQRDIMSSTFKIPINATLSSPQLQAISRSCGTYIESVSPSEVSISYLKSQPGALGRTQRSLLATAYNDTMAPQPSLYYHTGGEASSVEEPLFSLLPCAPAPTHADSKGNYPTYRLERVNNPVGSMDETTPVGVGESLASLHDLDSSKFDFHEWLHQLKESSGTKLIIEASPGHVLLKPVDSGPFTTVSPIEGELTIQRAIDWLQEAKHSHSFHPFVPKSAFGFQTLASKSFQRLIYSQVTPPSSHPDPSPKTILRCLIGANEPTDEGSPNGLALSIEDSPAQFVVQCEAGVTSSLDVLIPERESDLRFTAFAVAPLPLGQYPVDLQEYARKLRDASQVAWKAREDEVAVPTGVNPPLSVYLDGKQYVLTSATNVRMGRRQSATHITSPFELVTETTVDMENIGSPSTSCRISCDPDFTGIQWDRFLRNCDWLTRTGVAKNSAPLFEEDFTGGL
ncbi:hypothetical protein DFP72DRAFT_13505 [Ephemerocybe angulata]|uniref:Uncharacterized protein n=1 Tax=Ephemerocybe angulata TaxID=980116 RepID=A0A8H6MHE1_9AGAR|nr:hypothetical protein DFP72DRAFT_13505 [Tulosesus angulatus]